MQHKNIPTLVYEFQLYNRDISYKKPFTVFFMYRFVSKAKLIYLKEWGSVDDGLEQSATGMSEHRKSRGWDTNSFNDKKNIEASR